MSKYMGFSATDKKNIKNTADDDWETDPDYKNDISEKDQRWGSKEIGGKPTQVVNMNDLREKVKETNEKAVKEEYSKKPGYSYGYGGKFGVQTDRMDKSAHTHEIKEDEKPDPNKGAYKPQGPLKDTRGTAKAFEDKAKQTTTTTPIPRKTPTTPTTGGTGNLKSKFDNLSVSNTPKPFGKVEPPKPKEVEPVKVEPVKVEPPKEPEMGSTKKDDDWETPTTTKNDNEWEDDQSSKQVQPTITKQTNDEWNDDQQGQQNYGGNEEQSYGENNEGTTGTGTGTGAGAGGNGEEQLPAQVRGLYDFDAQDNEELGFRAGDIITVHQAVDSEWWQGELDGRYGIFPVSYVEPL